MALRDRITEVMLSYAPIPEEKVYGKEYPFYYKEYRDNLYHPMGEQALQAYQKGSGGEMIATTQKPAKMASIASSSAMTYNLLGDGPVEIIWEEPLPQGFYQVQYEKQMYTLNTGSSPANLDAFLSNESEKKAIFCEMKLLEWLGNPGTLKPSYREKQHYFASNSAAVSSPIDAYAVFQALASKITSANFQRYDAWQMFKHLLAIYNYTSLTTQKAVEAFRNIPSMAGRYERIVLANVVNEFPSEYILDHTIQSRYKRSLKQEQDEAKAFMRIIDASGIAELFQNNCYATMEVIYLSAEEFADQIDIPPEKRDYLKRYFP